MAIPDIRGEPPNGKANWSNGFLPAQHQAVVMAAQQPIRNLSAPSGVSAGEDAGDARLSSTARTKSTRRRIPGFPSCRRASMRTSWPRGCSFLRRRLPILIPSPPTMRRFYGTDDAKSAQGGVRAELPARAAAAGAGRAVRESLLCVAGVGRRRAC